MVRSMKQHWYEKEVPRKWHGKSGPRRACPKDTSCRYLWVGFAGRVIPSSCVSRAGAKRRTKDVATLHSKACMAMGIGWNWSNFNRTIPWIHEIYEIKTKSYQPCGSVWEHSWCKLPGHMQFWLLIRNESDISGSWTAEHSPSASNSDMGRCTVVECCSENGTLSPNLVMPLTIIEQVNLSLKLMLLHSHKWTNHDFAPLCHDHTY